MESVAESDTLEDKAWRQFVKPSHIHVAKKPGFRKFGTWTDQKAGSWNSTISLNSSFVKNHLSLDLLFDKSKEINQLTYSWHKLNEALMNAACWQVS